MSIKKGPMISKASKDFTCVKFYPDLKKFKLKKMTAAFISLLHKRVSFQHSFMINPLTGL